MALNTFTLQLIAVFCAMGASATNINIVNQARLLAPCLLGRGLRHPPESKDASELRDGRVGHKHQHHQPGTPGLSLPSWL